MKSKESPHAAAWDAVNKGRRVPKARERLCERTVILPPLQAAPSPYFLTPWSNRSNRRLLFPPRILCNIAAEESSPWLWFPSKRLPRPVIAIASADATSWPAYAMKTRGKAIAPPAQKTILNGTRASACRIPALRRSQPMSLEATVAPPCPLPPILRAVCGRHFSRTSGFWSFFWIANGLFILNRKQKVVVKIMSPMNSVSSGLHVNLSPNRQPEV